MNFSRLAPSPPFPCLPVPSSCTPAQAPAGGGSTALHQHLLASLLQKPVPRGGAACREGCLCTGSFSAREERLSFPDKAIPVEPSTRHRGGKRLVLDAVCWGEETRLCGTELSATFYNMTFVVFYAHIFSFITGLYHLRFCWYCFAFIFLAILYN